MDQTLPQTKTPESLKQQLAEEVRQRLQLESRLKVANNQIARLEVIADQNADAVIVTNSQFEIEWVSKAFTELTGYTQSEAEGRRPGELFEGEETRRDKACWALLKIDPVFNNDGESTSVVSTGDHLSVAPFAEFARLPADTHVLLCENGSSNRELIELVLGEANVKVTSAPNGKAGLDAVAADPSRFDFVLMDMQMPVMDGYSTTSKLREAGYDNPVIALTAAMSGERQSCLDAGCTASVTKPIDFDQLLLAISDALESQARQSANCSSDSQSATVGSIVSDFAAELPGRIAQLTESNAQRDWGQLGTQARVLRGAAGTMGFPCFAEPAYLLEMAAKSGDSDRAEQRIAEITELSQRL